MAKPKILQQLNAEKESKILLASNPIVNMEAATKQYVDNSGGTFYATVGSTSFNEISEALNKEKAVKAIYQDSAIGNLFYTSNFLEPSAPTVQGYTDLAGISSDGNQYIDTGYKANSNTRIVVDFIMTSAAAKHVFGGREGFQNNSFLVCWENNFDYCVQVGNSCFNGGTFTALDARHTIDMTATTFKVDGATTATYSVDAFTNASNLYLFACSNSDIPTENMIGVMYSCKIYDNNNLVRDFIPVTQDSTGKNGFYDKVNGVFYSDIAGGNFGAVSASVTNIAQGHYFNFINETGETYMICTPTGWSEMGLLSDLFTHSITERTYRPILVSTSEPTSSNGQTGDIWLVYEA